MAKASKKTAAKKVTKATVMVAAAKPQPVKKAAAVKDTPAPTASVNREVTKATAKVAAVKPQPAKKAAAVKETPAPRGRAVKDQTPPAVSVNRDPRLPAPGTVISRVRDGKEHKVKVLDNGFVYEGQTYRSLSAIANHIAGGSNNGFLFFHLIPKKA